MSGATSYEDDLPVAVLRADAWLQAVAANRAWRDLADGHSPPDGDWMSLFHPDDRPRLRRSLGRALESGERAALQVHDHRQGCLEVRVAPLSAETEAPGVVVAMIALEEDAGRARANPRGTRAAALRELHNQMSAIQELAHVGIWEWDVRDGTVRWSDEMRRIAGLEPGEFGGTLAAQLEAIEPTRRDGAAEAMAKAVAQGRDYRDEYSVVRPDGDVRRALVHAEVVADGTGARIGLRGVCQDVTDHHPAAAGGDAPGPSVDDILATVSHELRGPLTVVLGMASLLEDHSDRLLPDQRAEIAQRIRRQASAMAKTIERCVEFARLDRAETSSEPAAFGIAETVATLVEDLATMFPQHRFEVDIGADLVAHADPHAVEHILGNLLTNAGRFAPAGTTVRVSGHRDGEFAVVSVTDEGVGVPSELKERIFERWFRAAGPAWSRTGTGIGLFVARRYAELAGGRLWVESEPEQGATFSFSLPLAAADRARRPGGAVDPTAGSPDTADTADTAGA